VRARCLGAFSLPSTNASQITTLAVTSVKVTSLPGFYLLSHGSKFRCIRSTPTEMQSMSENDFECFASTGVNTPRTMLEVQTTLAHRGAPELADLQRLVKEGA